MTDVKICGLTDPDLVRFAGDQGARWVGFVFVETSPRFVTEAAAASLLLQAGNAIPVALTANPENDLIDRIASIGFPILQLHGDETPLRVQRIRERTGMEVWKAIGVSGKKDLFTAEEYIAADRLLIDAKPPEGADRTGGHGQAFDWTLLRGWEAPRPWILAGGLTPDNVAEAIRITGAQAVDVSSGVERMRGLKDRSLVEAFMKAAKTS